MAGLDRDQAESYLRQLGMGTALVERGMSVIDTIEAFLPDEARYLFVSEYVNDEGSRVYENLWVLSEHFMSEAHNFVSADEFDLTRASDGLRRLAVDRTEFDFETARDQSRLSVRLNFNLNGDSITGDFKASGWNCETLTQILREYMIPLLSVNQTQGSAARP